MTKIGRIDKPLDDGDVKTLYVIPAHHETDADDTVKTLYDVQGDQDSAASINGSVILPGSGITITATAKALFERIGPTKTMFIRGGAVVRIAETNGTSMLEIITPAAARSKFESYAKFLAYRSGRDGGPVLKQTTIAQEMAAALLEAE